jgi:hypothetical protein
MHDDRPDTISSFCAGERLSRSQYYRLCAQGKGPRVYYVGNRPHISPEARRERLMLEAEAAERHPSSRAEVLSGAEAAA